jgi:hypothetical protein
LPELTADDLKDLGVNLVGHRRRLLAAIAALRDDALPAPPTLANQAAPDSAAANYDRLVDQKNRYDPTNLFRHNQNIKPTV